MKNEQKKELAEAVLGFLDTRDCKLYKDKRKVLGAAYKIATQKINANKAKSSK